MIGLGSTNLPLCFWIRTVHKWKAPPAWNRDDHLCILVWITAVRNHRWAAWRCTTCNPRDRTRLPLSYRTAGSTTTETGTEVSPPTTTTNLLCRERKRSVLPPTRKTALESSRCSTTQSSWRGNLPTRIYPTHLNFRLNFRSRYFLFYYINVWFVRLKSPKSTWSY